MSVTVASSRGMPRLRGSIAAYRDLRMMHRDRRSAHSRGCGRLACEVREGGALENAATPTNRLPLPQCSPAPHPSSPVSTTSSPCTSPLALTTSSPCTPLRDPSAHHKNGVRVKHSSL